MQSDISNPILELEQRASLRMPTRGGRQAIEDLAISAYQQSLEAGASKAEAEKQYFEVFKTLKK